MSPECIAIPAPKRFREDKIVDEYNNHTMLIPSKVVHITNVSPSTTEAHFIKAFNEVAYVILMPLKEMALVEFECIQAANTCISETLSKAIIVKGQQLRISYSKYQFLKRFGLESEIPSSTLCLTFFHSTYPITCDLIEEFCRNLAKVLRIVIFRQTPIQVLVEFDCSSTAQRVKQIINGAFFYQDCCPLKVEFGMFQFLQIHYTTKDSFDYECPKPERVSNGSQNKKQLAPTVDIRQSRRLNNVKKEYMPPVNVIQTVSSPPLTDIQTESPTLLNIIKKEIQYVSYQNGKANESPYDRSESKSKHNDTNGGNPVVSYNNNTRPPYYNSKLYPNSHEDRPMQSYRGNSCHRGNNNIRKYESPADIERKNNDHALPNKYNSDRSNNNQDNSRLRYVCHDLTYPSHAVKHDMYAEERKHKRARIKSPYGKRADSKIDYQRKKDRMDNESSRGGYPNTFSDRNNRKRHRNDSYNKKPVSKNDSRHDDIEFDNKKGKNGTCNSRFNEDRHKSLVESKVIVIYGVNQTDFNCDKLFNLFCPYGNVLRVKFFITRTNMCMVEMECHSALKNVIRYLYNVKIMGTTLTFMKSKEHYFDNLNEPGHSFNLFDGSPSFKDFSDNKQLLRFNTPEMAIRNRLAYPSAEIRWFSVLCDISDEQIVEAFKDAKAPKPLSIKRNCNGHGRCMSGFIKFKNAEEAAEALATANNVYIYCSHPKSDIMLRMAFCDTSTSTTCRAIKRELQPDKSNSFNFKTD